MDLKGEREKEREGREMGPRRARTRAGRPRNLATEAIASVLRVCGILLLRRTSCCRSTFGGCFLGLAGDWR